MGLGASLHPMHINIQQRDHKRCPKARLAYVRHMLWPPRGTRGTNIIFEIHSCFPRIQEPDACGAPGEQIKANREVMENVIEDIKTALTRTHKDKEAGFAERSGLIFPIKAQGEHSESSLLRNLSSTNAQEEHSESSLSRNLSSVNAQGGHSESSLLRNLSSVNAQGGNSESSLVRNLSLKSETRLSQLVEVAVERAVSTLIKGQNRPLQMCQIIRTQGDESRAVL